MELEFADHTAVDENHQTVHSGRSSSDLTINDQYEFGETGNGILHGKVFFFKKKALNQKDHWKAFDPIFLVNALDNNP